MQSDLKPICNRPCVAEGEVCGYGGAALMKQQRWWGWDFGMHPCIPVHFAAFQGREAGVLCDSTSTSTCACAWAWDDAFTPPPSPFHLATLPLGRLPHWGLRFFGFHQHCFLVLMHEALYSISHRALANVPTPFRGFNSAQPPHPGKLWPKKHPCPCGTGVGAA